MAKKTGVIPRVYWDSNMFVSIIEGVAERLPAIMEIMNDAEDGKIEIWTSVFSIAEVAFAKSEKDGKELDQITQKKINDFWEIGSPFTLVELHRGIMAVAAELIRLAMVNGLRLAPGDAVHIATAKENGISTVHTYDKFSDDTGAKRSALSKLMGINLCDPPQPRPALFTTDELSAT